MGKVDLEFQLTYPLYDSIILIAYCDLKGEIAVKG